MTKIDRDRETFAVVGELVMLASALDWQLNRILMVVLDLGESLFIEPVVATLDASRKIEILKARVGKMTKNDFRKHLSKYLDQVEAVFKQRNIASHTPPVLENGVWTFKPVAAAKFLKKIELKEKKVAPARIEDFRTAIKTGEGALGAGVNLEDNFSRMNAEKKRRAALLK
jgi:hypothetical protein